MRKRKGTMELIFCTVSVILISAFVAILFYLSSSSEKEKRDVGNLSDGWTYEDGSEALITDLELSREHFSIYRRISEDAPLNTDLCLVSNNLFLRVYCGDELVYDFHPDIRKLYGKAYGVYAHCINLPEYDEEAVLRIDIEAVYHNSGFLKDISLMNAGAFIAYRISVGMPSFILCIIIFIYGAVLLLLGVFGSFFKERRNSFAAIAAFSIISAVWTSTSTEVFQIITARPEIIHFLNYIALMLLSYPAVIYVSYVTGNENSAVKFLTMILTSINMLLTLCLNLFGVRDYHEMLIGTHALIALSILMIGYLIVRGFRHKTIDRKIYRFLVIAFGVTTLAGGVDLLRYNFAGNRVDVGNTFRLGLFAFILLIGGYELTVILELSHKGQQTELMEQIAYHDALTGLFNRQAFLREEKSLQEKDKGEYIIVQFDVNNLKKLNDTYGHSMGDRFIIGAATVIRESFGAEHCFRTGGDEFIAIIKGNSTGTAFAEAENRMAELLKEYNRTEQFPIELSIAYGYTTYDASTKNPESAEHLADEKMYEMKKKMKEAMQI